MMIKIAASSLLIIVTIISGCGLLPSVQAFSITHHHAASRTTITVRSRHQQQPRRVSLVASAAVTEQQEQQQESSFVGANSDFGTAMPEKMSPYEQLGIEEEEGKLALGVDPNEVLTYIGTREDLIEKALTDISSFDRKRAEVEVDKLLLDAEMLNYYIQFQKKKQEDPDFKVPDAPTAGGIGGDEGLFSFRNLLIAYFAYLTIPNIFRKWVAAQEVAGTWHGTNIPLIDDWISKTTTAAGAAADAVQSVSDTVQ